MKRYKRVSALIVAVSVMLTLFAGCSSNGTTGKNVEPTPQAAKTADKAPEQQEVTINVWGGVPGENGPDAVAENFNKLGKGIKVVYTRYVNDESGNTKLDTALLSGGDIDVFVSHGPDRMGMRITSGMAEKLDAYLKKDNIDIEKDFGKSYAFYNDSNYALPITNAGDFIWINKKMFDEAKIPVPTEWTFDEYKAIAKQLTKGTGDNKIYGSMVQVGWPDMWMKPAYIPLGPESYLEKYIFNLDNPYFKNALQLRYDMEVVDKSQVPVTIQKTSKLTLQDMFFKGKVAMMYAGSWLVRSAKDEKNYAHDFVTAFAPLPKWSKDQQGYYNSSGTIDENVSINSKSKNKDAAWEFVKYWATEGYYPMCKGGKIPAWKKADQNAVINSFLGDNPEKIFDVESVKRVTFANFNWFTTPLSPARSQVAVALEREADKCLSGEETVDQAIDAMKKAAVDIIAKSK